jgi:DNA (cytosine-5)-methyltransferase 1
MTVAILTSRVLPGIVRWNAQDLERRGSMQMRTRSAEQISTIMRKVHSQATRAEVLLRRALWSSGLRYRLNRVDLPGKPDIVLPGKRIAVFVDGDYWHGHQWRLRNLRCLEEQFRDISRAQYWITKIRKNMQRDTQSTQALLEMGWRVLRVWESDIMADVQTYADMVERTAEGRGQPDTYSLAPPKTFAEFFAGIGLVRMALEREGWQLRYANDIEEQKYEMYRGHFADAAQHYQVDDIHEVSADRVPDVTLATASFPCNDLSLAGARQGLRGSQSSAFWGFMRVIQEMGPRKPPLIMLENVPGFLTSHCGGDFRDALLCLNGQGYSVDAFFLNADRFVPQSRLRLFVVGRLDPEQRTCPVTVLPDSWDSDLRPAPLRSFVLAHPEIKWSLRDLPSPPTGRPQLEEILEELPDDAPEWWSQGRAEYLLDQMSTRHKRLAEAMIEADRWSYGTVFRRVRHGQSMAELRVDGTAGCLRTPRGGSGRQILFKAGFGTYRARLLTPRECARLMGADDYNITVGLNPALFGFGDAVCVPAVQWIARYYLNPLVNEMVHGVPLLPNNRS